MRRPTQRVLAAAALLAALAGCGQRTPSLAPNRPPGYHPEQFADIHLPAGYVLQSGYDQLAVIYAGGLLRRFDVHLVARPDGASASPSETLAEFARTLPPLGWKAVAADSGHVRRWRKSAGEGEGEELLVEAGRTGSRTTIHVLLLPLAAKRS